jgi:hypothetical protein
MKQVGCVGGGEDRTRDSCLTNKNIIFTLQQTRTVYILDTESPYLCTVTKPDVATFIKLRNFLLKTGNFNGILPSDIFVLLLVQGMSSKIFGVSFRIPCVYINE